MSRLDEIKARLDAATPGPWNVWDGPEYEGGGADLCIGAGQTWLANVDHRLTSAHTTCNPFDGWHQEDEADVCSFNQMEFVTAEQRANANLIAAAPSDLRYLIAEVERLSPNPGRTVHEDSPEFLRGEVARAWLKVDRLERVLEWYADKDNHRAWQSPSNSKPPIIEDRGARARAALDGGSDGDR